MKKTRTEYEKVTVKLPKRVMEFLRQHEHLLEISALDYVQFSVIEMLKADLNANETFKSQLEEIIDMLLEAN